LAVKFPVSVVNELKNQGYKKIRLLNVPLNSEKRTVVAQGFVNSTISSIGNRKNNTIFPDYKIRVHNTNDNPNLNITDDDDD
jgi:hypothetical protein